MKARNLQEIQREEAKPGDILQGKKLVVLLNETTVSGAEIVAGALQDNKRATIVGVRSFGKASIETVYPMRNKTAVKLTTSRFYTPKGKSIEGRGIQPDFKMDNPSAKDKNDDLQLKKGIELLTTTDKP